MSTAIARPYAKAVFAYALDAQNLPTWAQFLHAATAVITDHAIKPLLNNPRIGNRKLAEFILQICQTWLVAGAENFIKLLAEKGRLQVLPQIAQLFEDYRAAQEKWVNVNLISALPIDEKLQSKLQKRLQQRLQRNVILHCQIDKNLLGGAIIKADDLVIDASVKRQLAKLASVLMA